MRLLGISAENFLSFNKFEWSALDPALNIIAGPNGVGKTNLFRAVRAVSDVLSYDFDSRHIWRGASRCGTNSGSFRISLDLELDGAWEREFLCAFVGAALWDQLSELQDRPPAQRGFSAVDMERLREFARTASRPDNMSWLFRGRLGVEYEPDDNWRLWYESLPGEERRFRWNLEGFGGGGISTVEDTSGSYSLSVMLANLSDDQWAALVDYLRGSAGSSPDLDVHRNLEQTSVRIDLQVQRPPGTLLPAAHREFERLGGLRLEAQRRYDGRFVLQLIVRRDLVFTDNIRTMPSFKFQLGELKTSAPLDLSDGHNLALLLFRLKNGAKHELERYKNIGEMFKRLTGREFDVGLSDQAEVRNTNGENDQTISLNLRVSNGPCGIPIEFSGAGVAELLFLGTIMEGTDNRAILLDEPALNLHPTSQAAVLKEIAARAQNQFIVITHSPMMVPADAISNVSRFALTDEGTIRSALDPSEWDTRDLATIQKEFRGSINVASLLFSNAVIFGEGETESGALPVWFEKEYGQPLERDSVAIHWVGGDEGFETYLRLARSFGIRWAVVCDSKVICYPTPGRFKNIALQMKKAGISGIADLAGFDRLDFAERRMLLAKHGVFTLAQSAQDEIEALPVIRENQQEAEREVGHSKARRGRYIAEKCDCPQEVATLFKQLCGHLGISCRVARPATGDLLPSGESGPEWFHLG